MELWKPVPVDAFAALYEVSSLGYVRRIETQRILKPMRVGSRRPGAARSAVRFSTKPRKDYDIAWLVLTAFVCPRPAGMVIMHLDDNTANNSLANLRWGTLRENMQDMAQKCRGGIQIIDSATAREIVRRRRAGERGRYLAKEFGVSEQRICDLFHGRTTLL